MSFRVGQQVVCIKRGAWNPPLYPQESGPIHGGVYTITAIHKGRVTAGLILDGFDPFVRWCASRFRPVKETDISIFTDMLVPTPKQEVDA